MAATTAVTNISKIQSFVSCNRRKKLMMNLIDCSKVAADLPNCFSRVRRKGSFLVRAYEPERGEERSSNNDGSPSQTSQEDFNYLWKVGAGSFIGAAVIKYGSITFPDITRPNIFQALIMIFAPVIIAVLLLIKESRVK